MRSPYVRAMDKLYLLCITIAVISVVAWLVIQSVMGVRKGQMKRIDHDINES